jgi:hypothetical protein
LCISLIKSVSSLRKEPLTEKARFLYAQQRASVFKALESVFSKLMPFRRNFLR